MAESKGNRKKGRPIERANPQDVVEEICDRLIDGESIRSICEDPSMPGLNTFYRTMAKDEDFRNAIARARELQQDAIIDSTIDLADSATPETVQVAKLQIWARQWRAAKLAPKRYGDKMDINHGGSVIVKHVSNVPQE